MCDDIKVFIQWHFRVRRNMPYVKVMRCSFPGGNWILIISSFSHSVMSNSLQPHGLQHTRLPCPSPSPGCSNSCPSHPLSPPSPPALNLSQHQGLFQWVGSSHQVAQVLELQHQSFWWIFRVDFLNPKVHLNKFSFSKASNHPKCTFSAYWKPWSVGTWAHRSYFCLQTTFFFCHGFHHPVDTVPESLAVWMCTPAVWEAVSRGAAGRQPKMKYLYSNLNRAAWKAVELFVRQGEGAGEMEGGS